MLMQFSSLGSSKMEISETGFFDTLTIQSDQISYVKHVLAPLYVFFTLFGLGGGWLPRGPAHNLLMRFSSLGSSRMVVPLPSSRCLAEGNRICIRRRVCPPPYGPWDHVPPHVWIDKRNSAATQDEGEDEVNFLIEF